MTYLDKIWEDKYLHLDLRGKRTTADCLFDQLELKYLPALSCAWYGVENGSLSNFEKITTFVSILFLPARLIILQVHSFYTSIINFSKVICHPSSEYCITVIAVSKFGRPAASISTGKESPGKHFSFFVFSFVGACLARTLARVSRANKFDRQIKVYQ